MSAAYKPMKIGVLNLSGNVGKTTCATQLLAPFRANAKLISVETVNNSEALDIESLQVEELKASRFKDIYRELMTHDDLILDVGASNVATFMDELTKFRSAIGEFDMIMVPTVPADKQQKDTIATIEWLNKLGIDSDKIRVVFNQHDGADTITQTYAHIMGYAATDGKKKACWIPQPIVSTNEIFELVKGTRKTIRELANDPTDWKAARNAAKAAGDMNALDEAMDRQIAHDLSKAALANLEQAYEDLLSPYLKAKK
jgi:MinD-like ATPase involved in chromosome partitioning or flagellar assembly